MKNIGMKENMKENIQRIWGESLKSLKSLMQIFAESAESANSAKQIFATFATFATFAMQIFHKGSYSAVRVSSVQQPTNIQRISNLSLTIRPMKVAQKSRIRPMRYAFAMVVMLTFGGWNNVVWGAWVGPNKETSGSGTQVNGVWYVLYEKDQIKIDIYQTKTRTLLGPGAQLSFDATKDYAGTGNLTVTDNTGHQYYKGNPGKGFWGTDDEPLGPYSISNVQSVNTLSLNGGVTLAKYVKKLRVTMAQYIDNPTGGDLVAKDGFAGALNFGTGKVDDANTTKTFTIAWCNVPNLTYSVTGTGADKISVSITPNSEAGKFNTATISVTYNRNAASTLNATLNIANTYGSYSKNISLTGSTTKYDQTLSWNNPGDIVLTMRVGAAQTLSASSAYSGGATGAAITYTSSDSDVLSYNTSTGKIEANAVGSATITASQSGTYKFNAAESIVTGTFVISDKQTSIFTPAWSDPESTKELKVGESVTMTVSNVSDGLAGDFTAVSDGDGVLHFSRVGNTITITAYSEGDVNAVFTQEENDDIFDASATYSFSVTKNAPTITVPGNQTLDVDGNYTASTLAYTNTSKLVPDSGATDHDFYYTINHSLSTSVNKSNVVITFDPETKEIVAQNAGTATITIYQKSVREYSAASNSFTITVNKKVTSLAGSVSPILVDATPAISSYSVENTSADYPSEGTSNDFYYTITNTALHTPTNIEGCAEGHEADVIGYTPSTHTITAYNAGTAKLTIAQKETYKYTGDTLELNVTVNKRSNALKCAWDGGSAGNVWSKDVNFDSETGVTFTSNNDAYAPIVVTQTTGDLIASYDDDNDKIVANFREGTARWSVSQAEDYKYEAAVTKNCTINVRMDPNCGCNIYTKAGTESTTVNNIGDCEWSEVGVADSLKYELKMRGWGGSGKIDIGYKDGSTTKYVGWQTISTSNSDSYESKKMDLNDNAFILQFAKSGTDDPYIKDIRVTRKRWFNIKNAAGDAEITELSMPSRILTGDSTVATFKVDYSTCASTIKVASNNPHIVVAASDRSFSSTTHGERTITLKYSSTEVESITDAVVTIYTPYEHKTLTVKAKTKVLSTTLEYKGAASYAVDHANMNATDLFQVRDENGDLVASPTITLISNATGVINTVSSNTAIDFICGGSATITASFAGVANMYEAASDLGQSITVNKISDAIWWSGVKDDNKIHLWTDSVIPTTIASANTAIASYSVAAVNSYLSVTEDDGVYTLRTGVPGEVVLTATSTGDDCAYNAVSSSKTIVVEARPHGIIWDQDFEGIQTDELGNLSRRITLNAYAVDDQGNPTDVPISYEITGGGVFASIVNDNELVLNVTNLASAIETTITATTTDGSKYAIVSETKTVRVVKWGTNTASSANSTSDIVDGKIVINSPHATFTFSGETAITEFGYATVGGDPEGYKLAQGIDKNSGTKTYNFSWECTNANCSIQVTKISFWVKAYNSNAFTSDQGKLSFDGADEVEVGTAKLSAYDGDFAKFSKPENYTNRNVPIVCRVSGIANFDYYIKNIAIEYIVYTTAPSATSGIASVNRTINAEEDKKTVDIRSFFQYATPAPDDFSYSYEIVGAPEHAHLLADGYTFWADAVGDYTVRAKVNMAEDHRESEWGSEKTIHVNKVPYVFNNSVEDKEWQTTGNWTIGSWPIENLPTEDDDVIVRGYLTIDEEIAVNSVTIEAGEGRIVEIAPTGGLTVGAGGITGATKDNLKLKAGTSGETKGQTGYLRISPEYTGAMPEATVEMLRQGYTNGAVTTGSFKMTGTSAWQYVGCPVEKEGILLKKIIGGWINSWDEESGAWINNRATLETKPFVGVANSQSIDPSGAINAFKGQLINVKTEHEIPLTYHGDSPMAGWNLLANSFAAPIDIKKMLDDNAGADIEQTVYLFNTGNTNDVDGDAGTYTVITEALAGTTVADVEYQGIIPAMQGFFVKANSNCNFTFNYTNAVWNATYADGSENTPMRVNRRNDSSDKQVLSISMEANGQRDKVLLIEQEDYSTEFENGYDAHYMPVGGFNVFAVEGEDHLAIDATNSLIGTRVGVRTGEETAYTLVFSHVNSEEDMMLWDTEADERVEIREGGMYMFFAEPNSEITNRFVIVEAEAQEIATGVEDVQGDAKVHKFIKDDKLFILKNGVLYDATGMRVR